MRMRSWVLLATALVGCGTPPDPEVASSEPGRPLDAGPVDFGEPDAGWRFVSLPGTQCATGAQTGVGYWPGAEDELLIFLQGGGACWNNGTCRPSAFQWGPVCGYGDGLCLVNTAGGTQPSSVFVTHPDPFPADGGGAFPGELNSVKAALWFQRRPENPMQHASFVFVPYCTGDLHAGDAETQYTTKVDGVTRTVTHHFAGGRNLEVLFKALRLEHPQVRRIWFTGASAGGYGVQLNLHRLRAAFPEAEVHLLADSAPMITTRHWPQMNRAWLPQFPTPCEGCAEGGLPIIFAAQRAAASPSSRIGLLAYEGDGVITRFFFSENTLDSFLAQAPIATYTAALKETETQYDGTRAAFFELGGEEHVMLLRAGTAQADGGLTASVLSRDRSVSLRDWLGAWATGDGGWGNAQ
jgi:hypothetical protein